MKPGVDFLHTLTGPQATDLARILASCQGIHNLSLNSLEQLVGIERAEILRATLAGMVREGWPWPQLVSLVTVLAREKNLAADPNQLFDLVLSGPDTAGFPTRDTAAVVHALAGEAEEEILLSTFSLYNSAEIFRPIADRIASRPELKVRFYLNVGREPGDTSLDAEIVQRFLNDFRQHHWPWAGPLPTLFHDPRALSQDPEKRACLHAKCLIVDRRKALVTSANFTEAGQERNIECGLLLTHQPLADRLAQFFEGLISSGQVRMIA